MTTKKKTAVMTGSGRRRKRRSPRLRWRDGEDEDAKKGCCYAKCKDFLEIGKVNGVNWEK